MRTDNVASFIRTALWGPSLPFSTHPLLVISRLRELRDCSILSFIHSPRDSFHFSSLALTSPRNKNLPGGREKREGDRDAVAPCPRSRSVISLKSNCTRKNGSPLSGKRIARLEDGRLSHAYIRASVGKGISLSGITLLFRTLNFSFRFKLLIIYA